MIIQNNTALKNRLCEFEKSLAFRNNNVETNNYSSLLRNKNLLIFFVWSMIKNVISNTFVAKGEKHN